MRVLTRRPNVYCKLSGLVEGTGPPTAQWPVTEDSTVRCWTRRGRC